MADENEIEGQPGGYDARLSAQEIYELQLAEASDEEFAAHLEGLIRQGEAVKAKEARERHYEAETIRAIDEADAGEPPDFASMSDEEFFSEVEKW